MSTCKTLICGFTEPLYRLVIVLLYPSALLVHQSHIAYGINFSLCCGFAIPLYRRAIVLRDPSAFFVHKSY